MKIISIIGARPQFIKAAVIHREIIKHPSIHEIILHTGQHFDEDMSDIFFSELNLPKPNYNLRINSLNHGAMTGKMMAGIEPILLKEKPDWVFVYGDTNSTLAGALVAKKLHQKVNHIEAGLRSFNNQMPEEINRIITDRISDILCCPTTQSVKNLENEGFKNFGCKISLTGDVMYDAVNYYSGFSSKTFDEIRNLKLKDYILCTIHRPENTDSPFRLTKLFRGLDLVHKKIPVILPLHPRTKYFLKLHNIGTNIFLLKPFGYLKMLEAIKHCCLVITDSGGVQKESFFLKKKCIVVREQTEWVELVKQGFNLLAKPEPKDIFRAIEKAINIKSDYNQTIFGKGDAGKKILKLIL